MEENGKPYSIGNAFLISFSTQKTGEVGEVNLRISLSMEVFYSKLWNSLLKKILK